MAEFYVEIWEGVLNARFVTITDFSGIKDWGSPMGTAAAVLATARWGRDVELPPEYRRRSDTIKSFGEGGLWEGTMGGRHFKFTNLSVSNSSEARTKMEYKEARRMGRIMAQRMEQGMQPQVQVPQQAVGQAFNVNWVGAGNANVGGWGVGYNPVVAPLAEPVFQPYEDVFAEEDLDL